MLGSASEHLTLTRWSQAGQDQARGRRPGPSRFSLAPSSTSWRVLQPSRCDTRRASSRQESHARVPTYIMQVSRTDVVYELAHSCPAPWKTVAWKREHAQRWKKGPERWRSHPSRLVAMEAVRRSCLYMVRTRYPQPTTHVHRR